MAEVVALDERARPGSEPGLVLEGADDPRAAVLDGVGVVEVRFVPWRDGRGYSTARMLRERGFDGDLRAAGDLTVDQLMCLARAGFSSVAPERAIAQADAAAALARFGHVYQRAADGKEPAWRQRLR